MGIKSENQLKTKQITLKDFNKESSHPRDKEATPSGLLKQGAEKNRLEESSYGQIFTPVKYFHVYQYLILFLITLGTFKANCQSDSPNRGGQIKIITWNIYMLPRIFIHTGQVERAKEIARVLKTEDADIIVFEEAFDNKARNIIRDSLKAYFPFESGDPGKNSRWKTSCGVWIISKVPIEVVKQIYFKEAEGSDRLATKGAILVQGHKNGFCFQLVGTHLQSDLNSGKNVQPLRDKQYAEIKKELLEPYSLESIPQFVAGDFNTIHDDSSCYNHMIGTIKFTPCKLEGSRCYSYDYTQNDLVIGTNNKPQLIDYLLYSPAQFQPITGSMKIVVFSKKWNARHKDFSDHFAVVGTFNYSDATSTAFAGPKQ